MHKWHSVSTPKHSNNTQQFRQKKRAINRLLSYSFCYCCGCCCCFCYTCWFRTHNAIEHDWAMLNEERQCTNWMNKHEIHKKLRKKREQETLRWVKMVDIGYILVFPNKKYAILVSCSIIWNVSVFLGWFRLL